MTILFCKKCDWYKDDSFRDNECLLINIERITIGVYTILYYIVTDINLRIVQWYTLQFTVTIFTSVNINTYIDLYNV